MPRKNKETITKKEEAPELSRRRSARLAAVEPKSKAKEEPSVKAPKRQAAKRASHEVKKTMAEEENVNSNVESIASVEKIDQDGDKSSIDNKDETEAKKTKLDDDKSTKLDEEPSKLIIDTPSEKPEPVEVSKPEEKPDCEDKDSKSEESGKGSEQNHVNNIESNEKVDAAGS